MGISQILSCTKFIKRFYQVEQTDHCDRELINPSIAGKMHYELKPWQTGQESHARLILRFKCKVNLICICCSQSYLLFDQPFLSLSPLNASLSERLKSNSPIIYLGKSNDSLLWRVLLLPCPFPPMPVLLPSGHVPSLCCRFSSPILEKNNLLLWSFFSGLLSGISTLHIL